jgi:hypothetical protein
LKETASGATPADGVAVNDAVGSRFTPPPLPPPPPPPQAASNAATTLNTVTRHAFRTLKTEAAAGANPSARNVTEHRSTGYRDWN